MKDDNKEKMMDKKSNYIGISEDRLHHILGVARKAYKLAKKMGYEESFCQKCFMLGWLHDVGYEFSENSKEHSKISAELFLSVIEDYTDSCLNKSYKAIQEHGWYTNNITDEYKILNMADMQVDSKGKEVDVITRLEDIKERYGEHSDQYLTACDLSYRIGLTAINIAANIT